MSETTVRVYRAHELKAVHPRSIIRLIDRYGAVRANAACQRALYFDNIQFRSIRIIIENSLDQAINAEQVFDNLSDAYTGGATFGRDTKDLFDTN